MSKFRNIAARFVGGERVSELDLSSRLIIGHLQITGTSLWAWYQLGSQKWQFTTTTQREQLWDQLTARLARLAGHVIKLRTTTKPYPSFEFARDLDHDTPHPLPDVPSAPTWDDYLERQQRRLHTRLLDEKVVTLGVRVGPAPKRDVVNALRNLQTHPVSRSEVGKLVDRLRTLDDIVAGSGLNGRPLDAGQMAWLMYRSVGMGMPVPTQAGMAGKVWESDDLLAFTDPVNWFYRPWSPTIRVAGTIAGREIVRHVAVLTVGRMADRRFPEDGGPPWMLETDRLDFPVEWSLSGLLVPPRELTRTVEYERNRAQGIESHYAEHAEEPPPAVARAIEQATQTYDEVTEGDSRVAVRFAGPIRLAVHAPSRDEALSRVRRVIDQYGDRLRIEIAHPQGQHELLREFIPGEPWSTTGYQRRFPVGYLAAAMPHVSSSLGTPTGPYLGYTIGSARRAVRHDGHYPMEHLNAPGLVPVTAEPGAGKSYLLGTLAYHAVRRGQPTCILDPSGPLARLCELSELSPFARQLDLTEADPGTLAPWQLIPEPRRNEFQSDKEYQRAVRRAHAERQQLGYDVMRMMLPNSLLTNHEADTALHDAIRVLGGAPSVNPSRAIEVLDAHASNISKELAQHLRDAAKFPLGELIFPEHSEPIEPSAADDKTLVVITMPGLQVPDPDMPRERWSTEELYAAPLMHLAAFYTARFIYGRRRGIRKNLLMDENHIMARWGSGRALFVRLARDSRKHDTATYASSQHPMDHLDIGKIEALIGSAFVGRLEDEEAATAAMRLLRAPEEYANAAMSLSPKMTGEIASDRSGEFLYRDASGRIETFRVDARWHPELHEALISTPGRESGQARVQPLHQSVGSSAPFLDPGYFDDEAA
ncbi:ATP-binding protein [Phytoactinopolyspora mesophila]|uniref:ATPase n=1 Tax=Phytoactinopolyspora mesophila TaxID=2650750 RepID=A0A7K3MCE3_9ACTN|nr:ATP-binding protein [Phytoactinopolyspora mesophila]NDL60963.1 hypothetical protein [Phytoactinopolyspora mesophila]